MRRSLLLFLLLSVTYGVAVFHRGVVRPPLANEHPELSQSLWIPKDKTNRINQLVLMGPSFDRGIAAGQNTKALLYNEERVLVDKFESFFRNPFLKYGFIFSAIHWFLGVDKFLASADLEEMYGVSKATSQEFNYLADPLTRQIAYHGLHEVGQMMMDQGGEDMGCTVFALPENGHWIVGRNFDFEGGRIFDSEKILKWVFPTEGFAFVSVIWAGMIGAVTGVNEKGVFISLNAAGSDDFRRVGTPSTLVLLKALQFSKTAEEAKAVIENATMFITDIFSITDSSTGRFLRVEKSPKKYVSLEAHGPTVITNHLIGEVWQQDETNKKRMIELTSLPRERRGQALLSEWKESKNSDAVGQILKFLRDKKDSTGKKLTLGNRLAIDALIATHSVIYDSSNEILYVSEGPAVSGPFQGYDLRKSFKSRRPIVTSELPRDPLVSNDDFNRLKSKLQIATRIDSFLKSGDCGSAKKDLDLLKDQPLEHSYFYSVLGNYQNQCERNSTLARGSWEKSLAFRPAHHKEVVDLERKLAR